MKPASLLALFALPLTLGCNESVLDTPDLTMSPADLATPVETGDLSASGEALVLDGTWALKVVNSQIFTGALGTDTVVITTLSRQTLVQTGLSVATTTQACSVKLTPYKGAQTIYPDAAVAAIASAPGTAMLDANGVGAKYAPSERVQLIGWTASTSATEALPSMVSDARVTDGDSDGHPGVTLKVSGFLSGDIYVANRTIQALSGRVTTKDRIEGTSATNQAQTVLDATNPLLKGSALTSTPDPSPTASTFALARVASGSDSCAQIIAAAPTLFP